MLIKYNIIERGILMTLFEKRKVKVNFDHDGVTIPEGTEVEILSIPAKDKYTASRERVMVRVLAEDLQKRLGSELILICKSLLLLNEDEKKKLVETLLHNLMMEVEEMQGLNEIGHKAYIRIIGGLEVLQEQLEGLM